MNARRILLACLVASVPFCLTPGVRSAPSDAFPVSIKVDAGTGRGELHPIWRFFGADEPNYAYMKDGRKLLAALGRLGTPQVYFRTHFLLNTGDGAPALKWGSTNVYTEDAQGRPVYDWRILDEVLDAITAAGARPFAQIGFMPRDLSTRPDPYRNSQTYALDGGCFYPPKDYAKWAALVRAWAEHARERYPDAESTWQWELWNEPNIGYFHGTP